MNEHDREIIENAIRQALEEYPDLELLDDYGERIAEFMIEKSFDEIFPPNPGENSIQWDKRTDMEICEIWSVMDDCRPLLP
jgi:hypothetical protein